MSRPASASCSASSRCCAGAASAPRASESPCRASATSARSSCVNSLPAGRGSWASPTSQAPPPTLVLDVEDQQKYSWQGEEIVTRLRLQLDAAFARVWEARNRLGVDWRTAAQSVAIERVAEASRLRTIYP